MNKKRIQQWIAPACQVLEDCGIVENGTVNPSFRSQLSAFGAASIMGSMKSAAAFFSKQGNASIHRELLLSAMYCVVVGQYDRVPEPSWVFDYLCKNDSRDTREAFLDAAVALKLAMNLFDLGKEDNNG